MPGGRLAAVRPGDSAELLAEFVLGTVAFCTRVARQDDIGHDLLCVLHEQDGPLLRAGPFFTVQVKSNRDPLLYVKDHETAWIRNQENPFFIAVVDRAKLELELYSTWNMQNGFLKIGAQEIRLVPGSVQDYPHVTTADDVQTVPLGDPIIRVSAAQVTSPDRAAEVGSTLKQWVMLDRENLVRKNAGMYWVLGPIQYSTNTPLVAESNLGVWFYWNPGNLVRCEINFGLVATALRLVLRSALGTDGESEQPNNERIAALDRVLATSAHCLNPLAIQALQKYVGIEILRR